MDAVACQQRTGASDRANEVGHAHQAGGAAAGTPAGRRATPAWRWPTAQCALLSRVRQRRVAPGSARSRRVPEGGGLVAGMANTEGQKDLVEASEQGQEAYPEQDQIRPLGQGVHPVRPRHPERQQDQQDPGGQVDPPVGVDRPRHHPPDDLEGAVEDKDQPQHRGQGEEGVDPAG
jgi:hypothetical protein